VDEGHSWCLVIYCAAAGKRLIYLVNESFMSGVGKKD